jgi:hypothetical protein
MVEAKQVFEAAAWFRNGLPAGNDYSRETAEANCKAAIGLASTKHRVLFGPLRWSEFDADDARAPTPPAEAPPGVKLLHVEAAVVGPWIAPWEVQIEPIEPPTVPSSGKISVGVHGDFTRYRYTRDDKQLWCDALAALGAGTWRDLRRQHRELRERLDGYAAWRALWDASPGAASVRKRLMTVIKASDSLSAALSGLDSAGAHLLFRHAKQRPVEDLLIEVAEIRAAAARARGSIPTKGGQPPDQPLHQLLCSLAELWHAEHGIRPPRPRWVDKGPPEWDEGTDIPEEVDNTEEVKGYQDNPFMTLCAAVAKLARIEFKGNNALAGQVLRAVFKKT